jgi:hypothetical protein
MIVSHKHKFICLNPPKTGSGFREKVLLDDSDWNVIKTKDVNIRHRNVEKAHELLKERGLNKDDYYWITFVRNPWTRAESFFNQIANEVLNPSMYIRKKSPYHKCMTEKELFKKETFKSFLLKQGKLHYPLPSQNVFYKKPNGDYIDYIGQLEKMNHDLLFIGNQFNLNLPIEQVQKQKINPSTGRENNTISFHDKIRELWTEENIETISNLDEETIKLKNYRPPKI